MGGEMQMDDRAIGVVRRLSARWQCRAGM